MKELLEQLKAQIEAGKAAFGRLTQREQVMVLGGAAAFVLIILFSVGMLVSGAIDRAEHRVKIKTDQLTQVIQLQGEYKAREAQRQARMRELSRANVRLVSLIEDTARQSGVEIGQLRPDDSEPNPQGIIESTVDLRATSLSADRLQDFLAKLERAPGVVILRRLKVQRPYRKDTVDLDMTVATYRTKT
jgi:type II secretory pathway component PulM